LDNSNIYGSSREEAEELRLFRDGKLRAGKLFGGAEGRGNKEMLPIQERDGDECTNPDTGTHCFNAGDLRVNEMIGLTATHLIWFREHNRLAAELKALHPAWRDEQLYSEARRILNAEYQHILYNEWLPIVVGKLHIRNSIQN
jgi:peroxidase